MWQISIVILALVIARLLANRIRRAAPLPGPHYWIAFGALFFAAYLLHAHVAGAIAEFTGRPLFRPVVVAAALAVTTILLVVALLLRPGAEAIPAEPLPSAPIPRSLWRRCWLLALPVAVLHAVLLIDGVSRPPEAFDGVYYHLPMIARWLRTGRPLEMPLDVPPYCQPSNCELWQWLPTSAGWENLIEPSLVVVGLLLALIVFSLAREFGIRPLGAWVATLFVLCCPMVALQTYGSYVDMFGAAFILGALLWMLRCFRSDDRRAQRLYALLAGVSGGIALGTKIPNLVWIGGVVMLFVVMYAWRNWRRPQLTPARAGIASLVLLFGAGAALCSIAWYVRNTVYTGWPFFPLQIHLAGVTAGVEGYKWESLQSSMAGFQKGQPPWQMFAYPWFEWKPKGNIYSTDNGLGPCFAVFVVLGVPYFAWLLLRRRQVERRIMAAGACLLFAGGFGFWAIVLAYNVRYAMPVWCLAFVMSGCMVDVLLRRHRYAATALVGATLALGCCLIGIHPAKAMAARLADANCSRSHYYGLVPEMDTLPPGTVILNLAEGIRNYALLGDGLKYDVIESMRVKYGAITLPVTQAVIDRYGINVVYVRTDHALPFAPGLRHEPLDAGGHAYRTYPTSAGRNAVAKYESK